MAISNAALLEQLMKTNPSFQKKVNAYGRVEFSQKGFDRLTSIASDLLDDFWDLTKKVYFEKAENQDINTIWDGLHEEITVPWGDFLQTIRFGTLKASDYKGRVQTGDSPDQFKVFLIDVEEEFYRANQDMASYVTVPDEWSYKQIFAMENGMDIFFSGIMKALRDAITEKTEVCLDQTLNVALNSERLQPTQKILASVSDVPTADEIKAFVVNIKNILSTMKNRIRVVDYNMAKKSEIPAKDDLVLLVRTGFKAAMESYVLSGIFNPDYLNSLGIEIVERDNFGNLKYFQDASFTTPLYEVYDGDGRMIGWNTSADQTTVTVQTDAAYVRDDNLNILGCIMDKKFLFHGIQNPTQIEPARNAMGSYTNYIYKRPNDYFGFRNSKTFIRLDKVQASLSAGTPTYSSHKLSAATVTATISPSGTYSSTGWSVKFADGTDITGIATATPSSDASTCAIAVTGTIAKDIVVTYSDNNTVLASVTIPYKDN